MNFKILIALFLLLSRPRKFDERLLDDQDDVHSTHSIGIVENPLYAEQEEHTNPFHAALRKKEAEADVSPSSNIMYVCFTDFYLQAYCLVKTL